MKKDIADYVAQCFTCQKVKTEHQKSGGLLQYLTIPVWKWDHITMDFVVGMPRTQRHHDAIWVIVDQLSKSTHFLAIKTVFNTEQLAKLYIKEIVRLHGTKHTPRQTDNRRELYRPWRICYKLAP